MVTLGVRLNDMTFIEMVEAISARTDLTKREVKLVLQSFTTITKTIVERGDTVHLPDFGRFRALVSKPKKAFGKDVGETKKLRFRAFGKLGEKTMEKYAVVYDEDKTKTASIDRKCPKCGGPVSYGKVVTQEFPWCERCGTEPWEKERAK